MLRTRVALVLLAVAAIAAVGIAAGCGSNDNEAAAPATTAPSTSGSGSGSGAYGAPAPTAGGGSTAPTGPATVSTASGDLGEHLIGPNQHTLYLFEKDTGSTSTCSGACASDWPPLLTTGSPMASGGAQAGMLGTTKRDDGTTQVTYGGHPIYYYAGDTAPGQTAGQELDAFGAEWYVVSPSGDAIEGEGS